MTESSENIWSTREKSWAHLQKNNPSSIAIINESLKIIDRCLDYYEAASKSSSYGLACGLFLLKGKNLGHGCFSLILDGHAQEAGALLRPLIECIELLAYMRIFPEKANDAVNNKLPSAGQRAKEINGEYKGLREHLNDHASHISFSPESLSHLLNPDSSFRRTQESIPEIILSSVSDLAIQIQFLMHEGIRALERVSDAPARDLGTRAENLRKRSCFVFGIFGN
ncbi:hypothetical protein [Amphibiibacter pelophylacis]|uniref:Uncharacterized protein n=1 Tax=Amphibiibacter pelophylacis TaxID=1799477 RepID=A0ACC6P0H8_9BURK